MTCLRLLWTGRMFLWMSSIGPGRWEILSFRSSARRARFSRSCLAWRDGSADVSIYRKYTQLNMLYITLSYCFKLFDSQSICLNLCSLCEVCVCVGTVGGVIKILTFKNVHPDQLWPLWTTADLSLQVVLSLRYRRRVWGIKWEWKINKSLL